MPVFNADMQLKLAHFKEAVNELGKDKAVLKLSKHYSREEVSFLMDQINGREVAEEKFPSLAQVDDIIYPPSYYLEQTSSERTAGFKAGLVSGELLIDMTGGFGIDTYFFSKQIPATWYIEQDPAIFEIASQNLQKLNPAIKTITGDSLQVLQQIDRKADWLYLDPIRRTKDKRLSGVEEYSPNLHVIQDMLFEHAAHVMVKLSPMTDISEAVKIFGNKVSDVYVLATDNECKELVLVAHAAEHAKITVTSINWTKNKEERFVSTLGQQTSLQFSGPLEYLYEPNAAVFKAQQYDEQASKHSLFKLHSNTHVYTSSQYHPDYQGKVYKVRSISSFDGKSLREHETASSFNIKTRNFPASTAEVARKLRIKEGGYDYLFCVRTTQERLRIIACERQ